jgi:hypothetical protein
MTEQEWLESTDPRPMLEFLGGKASDRKVRLFAVACVRRLWDLTDYGDGPRELDPLLADLDLSERFADGRATLEDLATASLIPQEHPLLLLDGPRHPHGRAQSCRISAVRCAVAVNYNSYCQTGRLDPQIDPLMAAQCAAEAVHWGREWSRRLAEGLGFTKGLEPSTPPVDVRLVEREAQAALLRDLFGNPFRPASLGAAWLTRDASTLAQSIYDDRNFVDLPILADALEDSGCTDPGILGHCRSGGDHVRGCWVVDLVLNKK